MLEVTPSQLDLDEEGGGLEALRAPSTILAPIPNPSIISSSVSTPTGTRFAIPAFRERRRRSLVDGPLAYEWESAKTKPHARIISRKAPKLSAAKTGEMQYLFGASRYGYANPPKAVLIGRTRDPQLPKPDGRPAAYSDQAEAGEGKPNPLILSRKKPIGVGSGCGVLQNVFGMTRFGRANPPRPVIISRPIMKEKRAPGPGAYESKGPTDTKVGIQIKGRLAAWENDSPQPGANAYTLPSFMGIGPAFSFAGRYEEDLNARSPGPIYNIRQPPNRKKGITLTFKPFPVLQGKEFPSPNEYANSPASQKITMALLKAPTVRFAAKPYIHQEYYGDLPVQIGPGPADFNIRKYSPTGKSKPKAIIMSRPLSKFTSCGSGKLENLFGKTRFGTDNPPRTLIVSRHPKKEKVEPGPGAYESQIIIDNRVGIKMKARWASVKHGSTGPGPGDYNLPSFIGKGPAFSLVPKFKGEASKLDKVPKLEDDKECREKIERDMNAQKKLEQAYDNTSAYVTNNFDRLRQIQDLECNWQFPNLKDVFPDLDRYLQ